MSHVTLLFLFLISTTFSKSINDGQCAKIDSVFVLEDVIGPSWRLQAVIPLVPLAGKGRIPCVAVNFTEAEYDGVKFLAENTLNLAFDDEENLTLTDKIIIRQRYYDDSKTYDIWSVLLDTKGCFKQILTMNSTQSPDFEMFREPDERMQLSLIDLEESTGQKTSHRLLVQLLWGNHIGAVIYADNTDLNDADLQKAYDFVSKIRGPQLKMKKCDVTKKQER